MNNIGKIQPAPIVEEMQKSYLDYAMSVIVSRALPDVRDGLKPVQRRIIYAMHAQGLHHTSRFQKSAAVVGEVMKNLHPHGDAPIYEAMVRMAQNFSMRYMLVDGQGNFGCFTKDTKIKLTDGRDLSFKDFIKEAKAGKKNYTYTVNSTGLISIAEIKNPRLTIKKAKIIKLILDTGEQIKCTPNHLFMLKNHEYKEAQYLTPSDSLMPLYQKISSSTDRLNREGYQLIFQVKLNEWMPAHHLADNFNLTAGRYKKSTGRVRHHIDFNKLNNNPENIVRIPWGKHWKLHYEIASLKHQDPEYRQKIAQGRQRMQKFLSEVNIQYIKAHPEKRRELSKRAHKTLKRLWQNPVYRSFMHEKIIKGNKNHITNRTGKVKFLNICKQAIKEFSVLTEEHYVKVRLRLYPYGAAPLWQTGIKNYFENNLDLIRLELNGNHRVIKIESLDYTEDVYDLTIDKTHNFALSSGIFVHNSIDGDSPAAMRYTEARLSAIADELLRDINKNTVNFIDNYSGTTQEPALLPSVIPNLLLNGASGIAVGMATQIPPHNLGEVCDALMYMIEHPSKQTDNKNIVIASTSASLSVNSAKQSSADEVDRHVVPQSGTPHDDNAFSSTATVEDLITFIKGPDFPTGASIYDQSEILAAYATGKGRIVMRAKAEIDETPQGKMQIIVSELPYQVNKATLIARIAELIKDKKIDGVADLRDESDRKQMVRIVFDLKRDAKPQAILNSLYKYTAMQSVFNVNLVALVDGVPHLLTLKHILEEFIHHRQIVVRKRSEFELAEAKTREHILEGLKIAVDNIDAAIETIKKSKDADTAKQNLIARFKLTEIQALAILDLQLRRLAALERQKIEDELKMVRETIAYLEDLLAHPEKILKVVKNELTKLREKYIDDRKTRVYKQKVGEFSEKDLVPNEVTIVTITEGGYIKRQSPMSFRIQQRGGKGVMGIATKEADAVSHIFYTQTHDNILFFTDKGRVFQIKVWEIPGTQRAAKGQAVVNLINIEQGEKVTGVLTTRQKGESTKYFFMCTKRGTVKKTALEEYANIRKGGLIAIKLDPKDELCWVAAASGQDDLIIVSRNGQSIRFSETQVKPTHRDTSGVRGIKLGSNDEVVALNIVKNNDDKLLVIMENGLGKKTPFSAWSKQGRGGQGVKAAQVTSKTGPIVTAQAVDHQMDTLVLTSTKGQLIKMDLAQVPILQRQTQGVILMRVRPGEKVAAATVVCSKDKTEQ